MRDKDKIIFAAYFQIVDFSGDELQNYIPENTFNGAMYKLSQGFNRVLSYKLNRIKWKILVSGNLFITGDSGFHFHPEVTDDNKFEMIHEVVDCVVKNMTQNEKINAILLKDIYKFQTDGDSILRKSNFSKFEIEHDMIFYVDPSWKKFEDYLASVSSKYRVRTKKVMKVSSGLQRKELSLHDIQDNKEKLFELYMNVASRAPFNLAYLTPNYFHTMKEAMDDRFRIFGYYYKEELIAFVSVFRLAEHIEVSYVGLEYELNRKLSVYQRMLYDNIALGIDEGVEKIHYGRTAPEIKSTVGARPFEMYCYLKHTNPFSNFFIKPLTSYMKPKDWVLRNPFKENAYNS
ncbi:MAG: GNAT family N-acetyltransferase [Bacteroidia bacterium]|nr:GNAT family N-acetyltransferase [Bacteroidia bacterium]